MYGLVSSEFALGNPLTPAEIASYLDLLPEDLSPERRAVITCALNSVGKIPYYYGGKPSTAGLSGNHFASVTSPDYKGRILSGLDCSGWVNWYTGPRLAIEWVPPAPTRLCGQDGRSTAQSFSRATCLSSLAVIRTL